MYIYGIDQANSQPNIVFTLGSTQSTHHYTGTEQYAYHALFFSATQLPEDEYTVNWIFETDPSTGVLLQEALFDYAIVTSGTDDPTTNADTGSSGSSGSNGSSGSSSSSSEAGSGIATTAAAKSNATCAAIFSLGWLHTHCLEPAPPLHPAIQPRDRESHALLLNLNKLMASESAVPRLREPDDAVNFPH